MRETDHSKDLIAAHAEPHVNRTPRYRLGETFAGSPRLLARRYAAINLVSRSRNMRNGKTNPAVAGTWTEDPGGGGWLVKVARYYPLGETLDVAVRRADGQIAHVRGAVAVGYEDDGYAPETLFRPARRLTVAEQIADYEDELDEAAEEEDYWNGWACKRYHDARRRIEDRDLARREAAAQA